MANTVNVFDFQNETLAQFLAKSISDGTYANVLQALKVDQSGEAAAATDIVNAAGQLWSNMTDDFVIAAYPLMRSVSLGVGVRLVETASPTFGGTPPALTYTLAGDERLRFTDQGLPPGNTLTITLPAISTLSPGQEVSLRLPSGNPISAITLTPDASDTIVDPATGLPVGPPGTALVIAVGTYSSGVNLTWQMVASTPNATWSFEYDNAGSGSGGGDWPTTLAAGRTSGGNDPQITSDDRVEYGTGYTKVTPASDNSRQVTFASAGGGALVNVGASLYQYLAFASVGDRVIVRATGSARISNGSIATTTLHPFVLEQEWSITSGGDSVISTILSGGSGVGQIAFGVDVSGPQRDLFLKVNEGVNAGYTVDVNAKITVTACAQEIA